MRPLMLGLPLVSAAAHVHCVSGQVAADDRSQNLHVYCQTVGGHDTKHLFGRRCTQLDVCAAVEPAEADHSLPRLGTPGLEYMCNQMASVCKFAAHEAHAVVCVSRHLMRACEAQRMHTPPSGLGEVWAPPMLQHVLVRPTVSLGLSVACCSVLCESPIGRHRQPYTVLNGAFEVSATRCRPPESSGTAAHRPCGVSPRTLYE
mmetsp:Transcript_5473/g.13992  ORF Transcript_5473/g.13992 Transcript_5473/m.13992 type:complete len:203 (-) Transcript_5473:722-1330(-)